MRIAKLSFVCLLLMLTFTVGLGPKQSTEQKVEYLKRNRVTGSALPLLVGKASFPILSAQGVIAVDLDSATVLYEKNADYSLLPASTTKILTALVALDHYKMDDIVQVPWISVIGQKMNLVAGEKITFENLLYGLLVYSANDSAEVLATRYPGGREAFIAAMNQKAQEFGMKHSYFVNPTGLDNNEHVSTARDMIRLSEIAMRNPIFAEVVKTKELTVKSIDGRIAHRLTNINQLLGSVPGVMGVKTGWTEGARENLVTYVVRDDKKVLIALLGSQDRFGETKQLIEWIFANYQWQNIAYNK